MLDVVKRPRRLEPGEIETLISLDVPARLATLDHDGFPHVTPLWFVWADGAFFMTSIADRLHVRRLSHNPRAGLCIDVEDPERTDGQRPNRQVRATGNVELAPDHDAEWTTRITGKYVRGAGRSEMIDSRAADDRMVICLRPTTLIAVASV
jgi:nitroimidazol reductase NimA-like FMN-containing flavoprotein (pyridoxamine 5'-phosphate oxidase superfamily)